MGTVVVVSAVVVAAAAAAAAAAAVCRRMASASRVLRNNHMDIPSASLRLTKENTLPASKLPYVCISFFSWYKQIK